MPKATPWIQLTAEQANLVDDHFQTAIRYSRWLCQRHWDADECESRACNGLIRAARNFDVDRGIKFTTFLRNTIRLEIGAWRSWMNRTTSRRPPHQSIDVLEIVDVDSVAGDDVEFQDMKARIYRHLNPRQRQMFELRLQGYTYVEIAERMELSRESVNGAIARARRILMDVGHES